MATGYTLPDGSKHYDENGVLFDSLTSKSTSRVPVTTFYAYSKNGFFDYWSESRSNVNQHYSKNANVYKWPSASGEINPSYAGTIGTFEFFSIVTNSKTSGSSSSGGTVSGGGKYDSGARVTVNARPANGFVLTSLSAYSGQLPTKSEVSVNLIANADQTIEANFQKVYSIVYNANGGDKNTVPTDTVDHFYNSGTASDNVTIPSTIPKRDGYTFLGWSVSSSAKSAEYVSGGQYSNLTSSDSITLYAVWAQYSVVFRGLEGAEPNTIASVSGAAGDSVVLPSCDAAKKLGYSIAGWMIGGKRYEQGSSFVLGSRTLIATAVWASVSISKKGAGVHSEVDVGDIGNVVVKSSADNYESEVDVVPVTELVHSESGVAPEVPYDSEVEYIEGTGSGTTAGPYVFTDFSLNTDDEVEAKYTPGNMSSSKVYALWCAQSKSSSPTNRFSAAVVGNRFRLAYKSLNYFLTTDDYSVRSGESFAILSRGFEAFVDGVRKWGVNEVAPSTSENVSLLASYSYSNGKFSYLDYSNFRLHYFKVRRGGELIHDIIPVRFTNDAGEREGGLYDLVTSTLYKNSGTGEFGIGEDVTPQRRIVSKTCFAPKPNTRYRVSCEFEKTGEDNLWSFASLSTEEQGLIDATDGTVVIGSALANHSVQVNLARKTLKTVSTEVGSLEDGMTPDVALEITKPSAPDVELPPQYITGQEIVATARFAEGDVGWQLQRAVLTVGGVSSVEIGERFIDREAGTVTVPPESFYDDIVIRGLFGLRECEVSASADAPSEVAVSNVSVKKEIEEGEWAVAEKEKYGRTVRICFSLADGYSFEGLYVGGAKVEGAVAVADEDGYYVAFVLDGRFSFDFVIKAKVRVSFGLRHWNVSGGSWTEGGCSVTVRNKDGLPVEGGSLDVTLGDSVSYAVTIAGGWIFDAWFTYDDASANPPVFDNPESLPMANESFVPTAPVNVIARVTDAQLVYKTTIEFVSGDTEDQYVQVDAQIGFASSDPSADETAVIDDKLVFTYSSGTKPVTVEFGESIVAERPLYFVKLQELVGESYVDVQDDPKFLAMTNKNRTLRAVYTKGGKRTIRVAYADGSNRTDGEIGIVESSDGVSFEGDIGEEITLRATPTNGRKFGGWFRSPDRTVTNPDYKDAEVVVKIRTNVTLYAHFYADTHAVYAWEGSDRSKMMTWRSKTYVSPRPFNPVGIRVDAEDSRGRGQTVARVEVDMMSAPDSFAAKSGETVLDNMPNFSVRRLPKRRPERYLQVEVRNDAEVDRIVIGNSMMELAQ